MSANVPVTPKVDLGAVRAIAAPLVAAHGLELVDVAWVASHHGKVLRVTIDTVEGDTLEGDATTGVNVDHCVRVSRDLSTALDVEELIPQAYNLEVSSPGLDRPLRTQRDYARQVGRLAKVKLLVPASDGQKVLRGTIIGVTDGRVTMEVDGNQHTFSIDDVREAKLVFELGGQPKKQPNKRRKSKNR